MRRRRVLISLPGQLPVEAAPAVRLGDSRAAILPFPRFAFDEDDPRYIITYSDGAVAIRPLNDAELEAMARGDYRGLNDEEKDDEGPSRLDAGNSARPVDRTADKP